MAGDGPDRPIPPEGSPYLRRPLRTLEEAERDGDTARQLSISLSPQPDSPTRSASSPDSRDRASPSEDPEVPLRARMAIF